MNPQSSQAPDAAEIQALLAGIERSLASDPAGAERQASELLKRAPGQEMALLFQGIARRLTGNFAAAIEVLEPLATRFPEAPLVHLQLGQALRELGQREEALGALRRAVSVREDFSEAWLAIADVLLSLSDTAAADEAFRRYAAYAMQDPNLQACSTALAEGRLGDAESQLLAHLRQQPTDIVALCMLAEAVENAGRIRDAETYLKQCLELAPGFARARHNYAVVLFRQNRVQEALAEAELALEREPGNLPVRKLLSAILVRLRDYDRAIALSREILAEHENEVSVWTGLGHMLKTVGDQDGALAAYRKAIALEPGYGEPYWSLANIKTLKVADAELEAMLGWVEREELKNDDRLHFHFAIGRALEDRGDFAGSFQHYAAGNRLRLASHAYDSSLFAGYVERCKAFFTEDFFAARQDLGSAAADPIFVLGLPRSGSTLVEQILSSHSSVEGTMELTEIEALSMSLEQWQAESGVPGFPEILAEIDGGMFADMGDAYIAQTRIQRHLDRPFFVDKRPNNFAYIGLIHLILPQARIIDIRRHPMACGFSLFKEHFAGGQNFSYSLEDIGNYYRAYVELMQHYDAVLPGRVHRVYYESLVENTEAEIRRLLDYCALEFEPGCLDFYRTERPVSTASAEQVRSPIFRSGLEHWKNYQDWLQPLASTLGPLAENYPDT